MKKGFGAPSPSSPAKKKARATRAKKPSKGVAVAQGAGSVSSKAGGAERSGFAYTGSLRPGIQSPRRTVRESVGS